jgi:hypothetical protein
MYGQTAIIENITYMPLEHLTKTELSKLKKTVLGHGKLRGFSRMAEIHENTLRDIIHKGYAKPETITKVRAVLSVI